MLTHLSNRNVEETGKPYLHSRQVLSTRVIFDPLMQPYRSATTAHAIHDA